VRPLRLILQNEAMIEDHLTVLRCPNPFSHSLDDVLPHRRWVPGRYTLEGNLVLVSHGEVDCVDGSIIRTEQGEPMMTADRDPGLHRVFSHQFTIQEPPDSNGRT
jgi:hypothetical protein